VQPGCVFEACGIDPLEFPIDRGGERVGLGDPGRCLRHGQEETLTTSGPGFLLMQGVRQEGRASRSRDGRRCAVTIILIAVLCAIAERILDGLVALARLGWRLARRAALNRDSKAHCIGGEEARPDDLSARGSYPILSS
jgi:hypothetical protein